MILIIKDSLYGELSGTHQAYGMLPNLISSSYDMKAVARPEMYLKDRLVSLYEHNAYHDEQVRKGLEPVGDKLTLWM